MLDWILNLYKTKPVVFYALAIFLVPIALLWIGKEFVMSSLASQANKTTQVASAKDSQINAAVNSLNNQATAAQQQANDLANEAATNTITPDWNEKK